LREQLRSRERERQREITLEQGYEARNEFVERQLRGKLLVRFSELEMPPKDATRQGQVQWYLAPHASKETALQDWFLFINNINVHSGKHIHQGGLCLYVLDGQGYTVVDGVREDWEPGDLVTLPIRVGGVEHQHFQAVPGTTCRWLAFIYLPQFDFVASGIKQVENSADYALLIGKTDASGDATPYNPTRNFTGWMRDSFGDAPISEGGFNGYADLVRRRNAERQRLERAKCVVRASEVPWELNPQGSTQWYLHPGLDEPAIKGYVFYRQRIPLRSHSGKQRHQGGLIIYFHQGRGHTMMDGERFEWVAGDVLQLPLRADGVAFQHFNDGQEPALIAACEPNYVDSLGVDRGSGWIQLENCPEYDRMVMEARR
jgi:quercetin dioxygenase-like cupin family protein